MQTVPKVSICITTYNVSQYLRQSLESALMQCGDLKIEIVVVDDKSNDGTQAILAEYQLRYPKVFKVYYNDENLGCALNNLQAFSLCEGDYIAILDGDDFWIYDEKLKMQIEFLEENKEYAFACHDMMTGSNSDFTGRFVNQKKHYPQNLAELLRNSNICNSSVVYRNYRHYPQWNELIEYFKTFKSTDQDYFLHVLHAKSGKIKFFNEVWGCYREHEKNNSRIFSTDDFIKLKERLIQNNNAIKEFFDKKYYRYANLNVSILNEEIGSLYRKKKNFFLFLEYFLLSFLKTPFRSITEYRDSWYRLRKGTFDYNQLQSG